MNNLAQFESKEKMRNQIRQISIDQIKIVQKIQDLIEQKEYKDCKVLIKEKIQQTFMNAEMNFYKGVIYFACQKPYEHEIKDAISQEPKNTDFYLGYCLILIQQKRHQEAIQQIEFAIKVNQEESFALKKLQKLHEAKQACLQAIQNDSKNGLFFVLLGEIQYRLCDYKEAKDSLIQAIQINSHDPNAHRLLGKSYYALGQYQNSIKSFNKAFELEPRRQYYNAVLVISYIEDKQQQQALNIFKKGMGSKIIKYYSILQQNSQNLLEHSQTFQFIMKFHLFHMSSNRLEIVDYYQSLVNAIKDSQDTNKAQLQKQLLQLEEKLNEQSKTSKHVLEQFLVEKHFDEYSTRMIHLKNYQQAIQTLNLVISLNQEGAHYYNNMANAYMEIQQDQEALQYFDKAISIDKTNCLFHFNKANLLHKTNKLQKALKSYDSAIKISSQQPLYYYSKAHLLIQQDKIEDAFHTMETCVKFGPNNSEYYSLLGNILIRLQKYNHSINIYDQALSLNDQNPNYLNSKGISLFYLNKFKKAQSCFQDAIKINSSFSDIYANLAITNQNMQYFDDAIDFLKISIGLDKQNYFYYAYLGYLYYKTNLFRQAIDFYDKCLELYKKSQSQPSTKNVMITLIYTIIPHNDQNDECYKKSMEVRKIFNQI